MSKELTEQWRNGSIQETYYYVKCPWSDGEVDIRYVHNGVDDWKEIIAPVPTYEEYLKLESDSLAKQEGVEIVAELEHRLKEAESVIRLYLREEPPLSSPPWKKYFHAVAKRYLEKYKVEEK